MNIVKINIINITTKYKVFYLQQVIQKPQMGMLQNKNRLVFFHFLPMLDDTF